MKSKRVLMGFAALLIFLFHFYIPLSSEGNIFAFAYLGVDIFFFVSAYSLGKKEDIKLSLDDGYLTIAASFNETEEEKNKGKIIHRERHFGNFSRSFYVGEELEEKDIKAKLENGVLTLDVAKVEAIKKEKEKKYISIE